MFEIAYLNRPSKITILEREDLIKKLNTLFWADPKIYVELCKYCSDRSYKLTEDVKEVLIAKGFLRKNGDLPRATNEAVYETTTGQKPFWLNRSKARQ